MGNNQADQHGVNEFPQDSSTDSGSSRNEYAEENKVEAGENIQVQKNSHDAGGSEARFNTEMSAEVLPGTSHMLSRSETENHEQSVLGAGTGIGYAALAVSILSLFLAPVLFGIVGIVLGFMARNREAKTLGNWAIGIGAFALIVGVIILPFF
ncbi:DUF4190 domain-containing protein [Peribacillus kribbensis]|uniref:DUF4190 domain-containing protein n=1 Tax=Peribacillus kribbensis TaxID=356658 RepID=UPI0003FB1D78|nr:DUF4190 domain-containing protein [Peribacillus kribbensis]